MAFFICDAKLHLHCNVLIMAITQIPTLDEVLKDYCKIAIQPTSEDSEAEKQEKNIRNFVLNLQRDSVDKDCIYDGLDKLNPLIGFPLTFYQDSVLPFDDARKT